MTACGEERCCSMSFLIQSGLRFMGMSSTDLCYESVKGEGLALALCVLLNGTALSNMCKATIRPEIQAYLILCSCLTNTKKKPSGCITSIQLWFSRNDRYTINNNIHYKYHSCFLRGVFFLLKLLLDYERPILTPFLKGIL